MNSSDITTKLIQILGKKHVLTNKNDTLHYRKGFRSGLGDAKAVLIPQSLLQLWQSLQLCVQENAIIIMQAANTGLTEGSTPNGNNYDRDIFIISTGKLKQSILINSAKHVISFPGTSLFQLEDILAPYNKEPHSVIGSSCIGASVIGGIANNSGGSLINRGPAYTELSLYAQVNHLGELSLVNHLGIDLGHSPEEILTNLENENFNKEHINFANKKTSDTEYEDHLRNINANTPARFNADKRRLYEASGCAGKIAVFAVCSATFEQAKQTKTFYIGSKTPDKLSQLRRDVLTSFSQLPITAEYIHAGAFDIAHKYGKDSFLAIQLLGTSRMPQLFSLKNKITTMLNKVKFIPEDLPDKCLYYLAKLFPEHLPKRLLDIRKKFDHHLILKVADSGIEELQKYLNDNFDKHFSYETQSQYIECNEVEAKKAFLHRFVVAGAAMRYEQLNKSKVAGIVALDVALKRNDPQWIEDLPKQTATKIAIAIYYGHFFCYVFHRDYLINKGNVLNDVKSELISQLEAKGAKYPAEHNVGHLYCASTEQQNFYKNLDPSNSFNAGVGKMKKTKYYQ